MGYFATRFIDDVGDGSGSVHLNVNGSVTPVIYRIKPGPGEILNINRLIFYCQDTGTMDSGGFGNGSALTNGILFRFQGDVGLPSEFTYPQPTFQPILINAQWQQYAHDIVLSSWGSGDQAYSVRYTFSKDAPREEPWLADARFEEFQMVIQDDLTGISDITCRVGMSGF